MSQPDEILPPADEREPLPRPLPDDPHDQRGWSRARQAGFLRALSATHSVAGAARSVGMSRQSAYRLRSRLKGQAFDLAWEVAFHHSYDVLAHAALERALNGTEVPVFFQGEQVGSYRRFDERLTVALLHWSTQGGIPVLGRRGPEAERHAGHFDELVGQVEAGNDTAPDLDGASPCGGAGELERLRRCASPGWSDTAILAALQERSGGDSG